MKQIKFAVMFGAFLAGMLAQNAFAQVKGWPVPYKIDGKDFVGYLAVDQDLGSAKRPGVLLIHEWWGHNEYIEKRARDYAALGYIAFAADMYGSGILTGSPAEATKLSKPFYEDRKLFRSHAKAALEQLKKDSRVDVTKLAALGYCFGGTAVLELARSGAEIGGVMSFHAGFATPNAADMKNFKGRVIAFTGAEDPMVPAAERTAFQDELRASGVDWQVVEFGGAVHAFTNPEADGFNIPGVKYNALADKRSFAMSKDFLFELFSK